jgi:hypothetical protein
MFGHPLKYVKCSLREKDTFRKELLRNPQFGAGSVLRLPLEFGLCVRARPELCRRARPSRALSTGRGPGSRVSRPGGGLCASPASQRALTTMDSSQASPASPAQFTHSTRATRWVDCHALERCHVPNGLYSAYH